MKITEAMRLKAALEMIEEISSYAQSTDPRRDWDDSHKAVCEIYQIIHSIRALNCRKNHLDWVERIDAFITKQRKKK